MFSMKNSAIFLSCFLTLAACSGGGGSNNQAAVTAAVPSEGTSKSTTPDLGSTTKGPVEIPSAVKEQAKGTRGKPNVVASTKDMLPFHFYNVSGYKVCLTGTSAKDQYKKTLFINVAGPSEECGTDPKNMFTLILPMSIVKNKNLTITPGMKVEQGVVLTQKDIGNDRLVAFIMNDVVTGALKIK